MQVLQEIDDVRLAVAAARRAGQIVGFVPTMGALHAGHLSLVAAAREHCGLVVVSIFVNPTQFAPGEDLERYPRTLDADLEVCRTAGVDAVFAPPTASMYRSDARTVVSVRELTDVLCGPFRPGHFDGVATVVAKLFNIVQPDAAFFGEKDFQQLAVIRQMVRDLDLPIEIVGCPTVREADGLAMSSRNAYLTTAERKQATSHSTAMRSAIDAARAGCRDAGVLIEQIRRTILAAGPATIDYIAIVAPNTLRDVATLDRPARICLAVRVGSTRLIDNMPLDPS